MANGFHSSLLIVFVEALTNVQLVLIVDLLLKHMIANSTKSIVISTSMLTHPLKISYMASLPSITSLVPF